MARAGTFSKGQSGNPSGRPKQDPEVMEILRAAAPMAARKLVELVRTGDPQLSMRACETILNRVYGTPRQSVDVGGEGVTFVMRLPAPAATSEEWEQEAQQLNGRHV